MSQQTNLNVSPYFDDFDANNDYYRVLFKPGYPVQARELTTLQSILQNQIEKFGQHFFKDGAKIIPGNTTYTDIYHAVELENTYLGIPVSSYADQLIGTKISGLTSGVTAIVTNVLLPQFSERGNLTLYVNYLQASTVDNFSETFLDGELLKSDEIVITQLLGTTNIAIGEPFASLVARNATSIGSAFSVNDGVYFIRGYFINVKKETLILDQYSNRPSYRIGFFVNEEIVNSNIDENLNDNSQGFNNYSSPGADRLKISVSLFKKSLDDTNDSNFIEIATVKNGIIKFKNDTYTQYNLLSDEFARRTYDESGDYYIRPFNISVKESLNDNLGNNGVFPPNTFTDGGSVPSENLSLYQISPGKAYVRGYEVDVISSTLLDVPKPRQTKTIEQQSLIYNTGSTLRLNRVYGAPKVGIGNTYVISLRDSRVGVSSHIAPGKEIGLARVYDFRLESGSYDSSNSQLNEWNISLFDIQTVTEITVNESVTLNIPTFVKGKSTGATGFLKENVNSSKSLVLYQTTGNFSLNESLIFDGIESNRVSTAVTSYGFSDVKSLYGVVGTGNTFTADVIQSAKFNVGVANVTQSSSGISTITSTNPLFPGKIVKNGDLLKYTDSRFSVPVFVKVEEKTNTSISVSGITTVANICEGSLPLQDLYVSDLQVLHTTLESSSDNTLYTKLPKNNISNVNLADASLTIRKTYNTGISISSNELTTIVADSNEFFLPFDEERYLLVRSDGSIEPLSTDKVKINGNTLEIKNLGSYDPSPTLVATLRKINPKEKIKKKNRVKTINVNKSIYEGSGTGEDTLNNGLTYGNYPYGTRVEDDIISLNEPDIIEVHGIYESRDTGEAYAPSMSLASISGPSTKTSDLVIGESLSGQTSGAIAIVVGLKSDNEIYYITKNNTSFVAGEQLLFGESGVLASIVDLQGGDKEITSHYTLNPGQKSTIYDYGRIVRKSNYSSPTKSLKIYFSNLYYDSSDDGDITTANSYFSCDYSKEIDSVNGIRLTDLIDIRPRVNSYSVSENSFSPLEFKGRTFNASGNSAKNSLASDESIDIDYSFYLGRIDRIYLNKTGKFHLKIGTPSENPEKPIPVDDSLEIASITLPPYLYNTSQASIEFISHKRYRMTDIKKLEDRIKNLEYYSSLSLLENKVESLTIQDSFGLNRFKSGFFVDNFSVSGLSPQTLQDNSFEIKNSVDTRNQELRPLNPSKNINLTPFRNENDTNIDSINVVKNGSLITLDYSEVEWNSQKIATRPESVTPFIINYWTGILELTPFSDNWVGTKREASTKTIIDGAYELARKVFDIGEDGFSPTTYNEWQEVWNGTEVKDPIKKGEQYNKVDAAGYLTTTTVFQDYVTQTYETGYKERTGSRIQLSSTEQEITLGDRVIKRDNSLTMRARNIQFVARNLKPLSEVIPIFDNVVVDQYCIPKLIQISMVQGIFQSGENVRAISGDGKTITGIFRICSPNHKFGQVDSPSDIFTISPYSQNQDEIIEEQYSSSSNILNIDTESLSDYESQYSGFITSDVTFYGTTSGAQAILSTQRNRLIPDYTSTLIGSFYLPNTSTISFGTGTKTFTLLGNSTRADENFVSSGIVETVQENIISVKNPVITSSEISPERGENASRLVDEDTTTQTVSSNTVDNTPVYSPPPSSSIQPSSSQPVTSIPTSVEPSNAPLIINRGGPVLATAGQGRLADAGRDLGYTGSDRRVLNQIARDAGIRIDRLSGGNITPEQGRILVQELKSQGANIKNRCKKKDPLAQSFLVEETTGVFLTKCDIFFETIPTNTEEPVNLDIRTMVGGYPSTVIVPFSDVSLNPKDIQGKTSNDGTIATSFSFKSPVYLEGGKQYCICLRSESPDYSVFISRVLENDLETGAFVSQQNTYESLFKSQNSTTWIASPLEDLKYILYRADFVQSGIVNFYNPIRSIENLNHPKLYPDSLNFNSKKIKIDLSSSLNDGGLVIGNTIIQSNKTGRGDYVGSAGSAFGTLTTINPGIGYTPSSGTFTFNDVKLVSITGSGKDATANITITNGEVVASGATIVNGGSGYVVGDVLGISSIGTQDVGLNARFSVGIITSVNQLILDNVQGEFDVNIANTLKYINGVGTTSLNYPGSVTISQISTISDGLHIKVNHKNHGMHSDQNYVSISGVEGDVPPTKLTSSYGRNSTSSILVEDSSSFATFEGVGVGTTNPGYALIGTEVIEYTSVSSGSIGGTIIRNVLSTGNIPEQYQIGTLISKYELNGISLRRINKSHLLSDVDTSIISDPISFDSYHIKIGISTNGTDRSNELEGFPLLFIDESKSDGGENIRASENIHFETIQPNVVNTTVNGTSISAEVRTTTGKSLSGNEVSFIDNGYEPVTINENNYLDSSRIVCSNLNETLRLSGEKSLSLRLYLSTTTSTISPTIDANSVSSILASNKVNDAISNYPEDNRVNSIVEDPTAFQYVSKEIVLEASASSIKIILDAHTNPYSNIRAFYAIGENPNFAPIFVPFPGYMNLDSNMEIINPENNDGLSDNYIVPQLSEKISVDYKEHTFTIDNLPSFRHFRIKLIGTSTNQVYVPRIKNLRVIALA
jgi:hypothetical protein